MKRRILIVDDQSPRSDAVALGAARACPDAEVQRRRVEHLERTVDVASASLVILAPGVADAESAPDVIRALRRSDGELPVLVVSERDRAAPAVAALRAGASDYQVLRDGQLEDTAAITRLVRAASRGASAPGPPSVEGLVGRSRLLDQVRALVRTSARTDAHVLVEGETGTGKELVARAIHALSRRSGGPFVPVNCAAIPETLAESEFFGHARGAFTGAVEARPGALQLADRGTLFLDEIEDLPLVLQAKLLRVVQDREVRPLGSSSARRVDVRVVAASNRDLWQMVEAGTFRRDLYYRLRVLTIQLPPLRQRREDLPLLVEYFIQSFNRRHGTTFTMPSSAVLRPLLEHPWPGNVRELENTLESLLIVASASGTPLAELIGQQPGAHAGFWTDERTRILRVLEQHRWNRQRAAAALGISRVTLWRRMERHGIRDPLGESVPETG